MSEPNDVPNNFIRAMIAEHLATGRHTGVVTRFPPEPNGYLHIGHAKSICLNFGLAREFGGRCHMRFDDTNPEKEEVEYVESILADIRWLGFDWGTHLYYASDYFERMYACAEQLVRAGRAYVDSCTEDEIRAMRGTVTEPGTPSPHRARTVDENLDLLRRMRAGEFPDGAHVLRGRCDMAAANMKMRDPILYRIRHAEHHQTGNTWCIYPLYDYAHPISDAIEGITHSICTLEFENNREIYDWLLDALEWPEPRPRQTEFARLHLSTTMMSKRKLLTLVKEGVVAGWDDPRMPTIAGLRRRGVTPEAIRDFAERIGVAKANSLVDVEVLDGAVRDDLNLRAPRVMVVLDPLPLVLDNWPADEVDEVEAPYWPHDVPKEGARAVPFGRTVLIERDDFAEVAPKGWKRLTHGGEVRLRYGYIVRCTAVEKDVDGRVTGLRGTVDRRSRGGNASDGRKVAGTIHWVSAAHAIPRPVRLYDRLFTVDRPDAEDDWRAAINPGSLRTVVARAEPSLAAASGHYQFERLGYFYVDPVDGVFNRVVGLRDTWAKQQEASPPAPERAPAKPDGARVEQVHSARAAARWPDLPASIANTLAADAPLAALFDAAVAVHADRASVARWVVVELGRERAAAVPFGGAALGRLAAMVDRGEITGRVAKDVLAEMLGGGGEPAEIVQRRGLARVDDDAAIVAAADAAIAANPGQAEAWRGGRTGLLGFFVGAVMKATGGRADPKRVQEIVRQRLG